MDVLGFDKMNYKVQGKNQELWSCAFEQRTGFFKDIHFDLCFIRVQNFNFVLKGQS